MQVGLPHKHCSVAIPDGQNLRQKLQAVVVIKISIHQKTKEALCWAITVGRALRTLHVDAKVTRVFQISGKIKNCRYYRANYFWTTHDFSQRAANGTLFDVRWSLVAQVIPESSIYCTSFIKIGVCQQKLSTLEFNFHYRLSSHYTFFPSQKCQSSGIACGEGMRY